MRSQVYEQILTKQGVAFDYQERVALLDIDLAKGLRNQARLENPLDEELIPQYMQMSKDGMEAPAVVLARTGKGRWVPVDGNQRLAATDRLGKKTHDAYLLQTNDPLVIDRLTWAFNNLVNGKRISQAEAVQHAVSMVQKYDYSPATVAKEYGIPKWLVERTLRLNKLHEVLDRNKVKRTASLTDSKLEEMRSLLELGEDILAKAAGAVGEIGLNEEEVVGLVHEVKKARNHNDKLKVIDDFAASEAAAVRRAETKGGSVKRITPLPRDVLARKVHDLLRHMENYEKAALKPVGPEYKKVRENAFDLCNRFISLFGFGALLREESA